MALRLVNVRPAATGDHAPIAHVLRSAFPTAAEAQLVEALRAGGDVAVERVATVGGRVVGHVLASRLRPPAGPRGVGLAPLAVDPAWQRRGIGAALVDDLLGAVLVLGASFVVVLGDPAYYGRFGFVSADRLGCDSDFGGGPEFQVLVLDPTASPFGRICYAEPFDRFLV